MKKKFFKLQENSEKQLNEIRNKINEQKPFIIKETEMIRKSQRDSGTEMFNEWDKECQRVQLYQGRPD